jgi:hypothetical protein
MVIAASRVGQAGRALSVSACSTHWRSTGAGAPGLAGDGPALVEDQQSGDGLDLEAPGERR